MTPVDIAIEDVLRENGAEAFCAAYGIDPGEAILPAIVRNHYPSASDPRGKTTAIGAMQPALIVAWPGYFGVNAGIDRLPGEAAGIPMGKPIKLMAAPHRPTRGLSDLIIEAFAAPRPAVIFSVERSTGRALSRPRISLDPRTIMIGGEVEAEIDAMRIASVVHYMSDHGISNIDKLWAFLNQGLLRNPGTPVQAQDETDRRKAFGKICGLRGRFDPMDIRISDALSHLADLPDIQDPSWGVAARLLETGGSVSDILAGEMA